jgi:hypothetical protein
MEFRPLFGSMIIGMTNNMLAAPELNYRRNLRQWVWIELKNRSIPIGDAAAFVCCHRA